MSSRKFRVASLFVLFVGALAATGLVAPGAVAAPGDYHVTITNQPSDAGVNDLITAAAFDPTGGAAGFVQVKVTQEQFEGPPTDVQGAEVSFTLAAGSPSTDLHVISRTTNADGNAIFAPACDPDTLVCDNPLWIGTANEPFATDYKLVTVVTVGETTVPETTSAPFDIWEDGCHGQGCQVSVRGGMENYTAGSDVGMGASQISDNTHITCEGQRKIFSGSLFFHATTTTDGSDTVFLFSHITAADFRAAGTNFGQAHVDWCVGLKSSARWIKNGASFHTETIGTQTFYVAVAPKCPNKKTAPSFAPCILSRMSDGFDGALIRGYLPGGDPPRRT